MMRADIERVYKKSGLESLYISQKENERHSFLDAPVGSYPPRKLFDCYEYNLKKDGYYILKYAETARAVIAVASDEATIVDIFLDPHFQGKKITSDIVRNLYIDIKDNFFDIKNISLASLSSGIIPWHKMGFDFYNLSDRQSLRTALSKALGRRVDLKNITKDEFIEHNLEAVIDETFADKGNIPMYMEIIR